MNRKTFLRGVGLGTLGALAGSNVGCASPSSPKATLAASLVLPDYDSVSDAAYWRAVRAQFPIAADFHYMNSGGLGAAPTPVLDVFTETMMSHQVHPATGHDLFHDARETIAAYLGAEASEICFTRNATEGNSIIAGGVALAEGDEVIFENHAHPGGAGPWYNQANRRGIVIKLFEPDPESVEGNLARIRALITPRTKVIQISHVTAPTGIVLPSSEIAQLAHSHGIWFHVDGAQSAGMFPFTMAEIGCDSYATSGHKWMGAPHETGILFIRKDRNGEVIPISAGSYTGPIPMNDDHLLVADRAMTYTDGAMRHEYATRNAASVVAVAASADFHHKVGRDRIAAHGRALEMQLHEGLAKIPTVEVLTPTNPQLCASITSFRTPKIGYSEMFGMMLNKHQFRLRPVSEQGLNCVRVSTHLFNSAQEVETLIAAISDEVGKA